MKSSKPMVFMILPFDEEFLKLYDKLNNQFGEEYEFSNAGDMDAQQNILKDIVEGIVAADVIIADLSGLNANVFYELGLAHALGKKVIIITQDLDELPFDIKSYRANQYGTKFYEVPLLFSELKKLLPGAIDGSVIFGSPVTDFAPGFQHSQLDINAASNEIVSEMENEEDDEQEGDIPGFLDYIVDITENSQKMKSEIEFMDSDLTEMARSVNSASVKINRANENTGNVDVNFLRNTCRKLSGPVGECAEKLKIHINEIASCWDKIENCYLGLFKT